jgi:RHS repeat-associated protein
MNFEYERNDNEILIKRIRYTGNGFQPYAKVEFDYTDLPDTMGRNTYFVGGYGIPKTKLLETITVYYENTPVRKYKFIYNVLETTIHHVNKYYERSPDPAPVGTRRYHYIYGDNGIVALHIHYSAISKDSMYYVHTDHLGSYCAITNPNKKVVQSNRFDPWGNALSLSGLTGFTKINRGFTGHEHYPQFKIINMNGRLYDPVIARFFSPDKYVANSSFTQDFNRYTYARNNPLMYTDPSGDTPFLLFAVLAGAMSGMFSSINASGSFNFGAVVSGGMAGAVSGAVGGSISAGVSALGTGIGFLSGFGAGAAGGILGGFSSAFISGTWNSWMQGNGFSAGLMDGMKSGTISAAISGAIGGITGGVEAGMYAARHGGDFWSGNGATFDQLALSPSSSTTITEGKGMKYNNEYARKFSNDNLGYTEKNLHADGSMAPGRYAKGDIVYDPKGREVWGSATYYKGRLDVYLYKAAFTSPERLYLTMQHEYFHVALFSLRNFGEHHIPITKLSYEQALAWNFDVSFYYGQYMSFNSFQRSLGPIAFPDPTDLGFLVYSYKPWLRMP